MAAVVPASVGRMEGPRISPFEDLLAVEEPLEIRLCDRGLTITMRTPGNDFELAAGFLFAEGIVRAPEDIRSIGYSAGGDTSSVTVELAEPSAVFRSQRNFVMTSACGVCGKASLEDLAANACPILPPDEIQVDPAVLYALPDRLRVKQNVFQDTGGLHAAARFSLRGDLEALCEDVGRHNAVDKLVGGAWLGGRVPLRDTILLVSGRASFELVQKALMAGVPIMAAVGAPSSLAVTTAGRAGMTLIGFLKSGRLNVYSGSQRIAGVDRRQ